MPVRRPDHFDLAVPGSDARVRIRIAAHWFRRAAGRLAIPDRDAPCGLWLRPCRAVHTFGMRQAIDVVFLRADGVVVKVVPALEPWRIAACRGARTTLELRAGLARTLRLAPGTALALPA